MLMRDMYTDVKYKLTDVARDLGFFRSKPYLEKLEAEMQGLVEWVSPPKRSKEIKGGKKGPPSKKPGKATSKGFGGR